MSTTEYTALRALDNELFAAHMARKARQQTLVLNELPTGWECTVTGPGARVRRTILPVSGPVAAMRVVERSVGRLLNWDERGEQLVVRDWSPVPDEVALAHRR